MDLNVVLQIALTLALVVFGVLIASQMRALRRGLDRLSRVLRALEASEASEASPAKAKAMSPAVAPRTPVSAKAPAAPPPKPEPLPAPLPEPLSEPPANNALGFGRPKWIESIPEPDMEAHQDRISGEMSFIDVAISELDPKSRATFDRLCEVTGNTPEEMAILIMQDAFENPDRDPRNWR